MPYYHTALLRLSGPLDLVADANPSHLPAAVPLAVGGAIAALFGLILLAGMVATALGVGQG